MPASYRNIIDGQQLTDALSSGDYSKVLKKGKTSARYIKGYAQDSAIEALAASLNINKGLFKQFFGLEDKKLDAYDPYHTQDAKAEEFWFSDGGGKIDGRTVQTKYDEDTNTFKRSLYSDYGYRDRDFWYEDPFYPSFELFFNMDSPFFAGNENFSEKISTNSLKYFIQKYTEIDPDGYQSRFELWNEFKNVFFKIFENDLKGGDSNRNLKNKTYYISKIAGINNLKKKMITYGEDKITITINEDVSMIAWYLSELYNNIAYSYRNQRYAFPDNVLRFDMIIKINDIRNFTIPQSSNQPAPNVPVDPNYTTNKDIKNVISPKSQIVYTLHDCNFNFFESRNHGDELEIGGFGNPTYAPQSLSFDIFYKSVTRWSEFPLFDSFPINPWEKFLYNTESTSQQTYYNDLDRVKTSPPVSKGYLNQQITKSAQNVANLGLNYLDNLEAKLREVRGGVVNDLLTQFRSLTNINKIEPDNVYNVNFNNRANLTNFGKEIASSLLNDLENNIRNATNF